MTTKLKIDLSEGVLEVEGSESFVKAIYNDFKAHFIEDEVDEVSLKPKRGRRTKVTAKVAKVSPPEPATKPTPPEPTPDASKPITEPPEPAPSQPAAEPTVVSEKPSYNFIKELDLSAADGHPSLVEFMDAKFPITNEERNLVFLHYLQNMLKLKSITVDHVYTCYRAAKIRAPLDIEGSLQSAINRRRWVKITKTGKISVTPAGKRYVEKNLPKKIKS